MKPRLTRIILTDWLALFCFISIPGAWIIGYLFPFLRRGAQFGTSEMHTVALPLSLIGAGFLFWRIHRIYHLFSRGESARGYITDIRLARDRGRIEFMYERGGVSHVSWTPIHQNRDVLALRIGQEVELLVDSARPTMAIIRHLYT